MVLMFFCIFTVAQYPMDWIDASVSALGDKIGALLPEGDLRSLVKDGAIGRFAQGPLRGEEADWPFESDFRSQVEALGEGEYYPRTL